MKKKVLLTLSSITAISVPFATVISCSLFGKESNANKSDLEFYNYEDYISQDSLKNIDKNYIFQTFGDLPEFERALQQERAVGGVGSDYFNVGLAKTGKISKLDLSAIFPNLSSDRSKWKKELQDIYTPEVWKTLNSFDDVLNSFDDKKRQDVDGDGVKDHLWEYSIPYFNQNKVIAFNKNSFNKNSLGGVDLNDNNAIQNYFNNNTDGSYEGILKKLYSAKNSSLRLTINDYLRDNLMIGSEVLSKEKNKNLFKTNGKINNLDEGKKQIKAFMKMIDSIGFSNIIWPTSGTDSLESILKQKSESKPTSDIALLYNGDAMAAINGGYNKGTDKDQIRIIIPKNSTFLTDGIVMSSLIDDDSFEKNRFYNVVKNYIVKGVTTDSNYDAYEGAWNKAWANYDYVNYTPAYKNIYNHMESNYFGNNKNTKFIGQSTRVAATGSANGQIPINVSSNTLAQTISQDLLNLLTNYYDNLK